MARDIGPDMLANLDRQLAEGAIDQHTYDSRRTETLELIRRGKAVEHTKTEMAFGYGWAIFATILAVFLLILAAANGNLVALIVGVVVAVLAARAWRQLR